MPESRSFPAVSSGERPVPVPDHIYFCLLSSGEVAVQLFRFLRSPGHDPGPQRANGALVSAQRTRLLSSAYYRATRRGCRGKLPDDCADLILDDQLL